MESEKSGWVDMKDAENKGVESGCLGFFPLVEGEKGGCRTVGSFLPRTPQTMAD